MEIEPELTQQQRDVIPENSAATPSHRWVRWFFIALRCLLGVVFVYAGISKLGDADSFAQSIANYRIMPDFLTIPLAVYLPYLEILAGIALISRLLFSGGILIAGALLAIFLGATGSALIRGLDISCGCFGSSSASLPEALARNIILALVWSAVTWWFLRQSVLEAAASETR